MSNDGPTQTDQTIPARQPAGSQSTQPLVLSTTAPPANNNNSHNNGQTDGATNSYALAPDNTNSTHTINTEALNGLRGLVSVHIMIFHTLIYNQNFIVHTIGSVQMPLFFILSGFILALNAGRNNTQYARKQCCCCNKPTQDTNDSLKTFNFGNFLQRRCARIVPMYYLSSLLLIPLAYVGYCWALEDPYNTGHSIAVYVFTFTITGTWLGVSSGLLINGPAWFVSSIVFMYLFFPCIFTKYQRLSQIDTKKVKSIISNCFIIQLILALFLYFPLLFTVPAVAWSVATWWPVARMPVFAMGVLAGLLRLNASFEIENKNTQNTKNITKNIANNVENTPNNTANNAANNAAAVATTAIDYNKSANNLGLMFIIVFLIGSIADTLSYGYAGANFFLQIALPWWQLKFIFVLTKCDSSDANAPRTYKILTHRVMLWLGKISYGVYLLHMVVMQYICWVVHGTQSVPDDYGSAEDCECWEEEDEVDTTVDLEDVNDECCEQWEEFWTNRTIPGWSIPVVWVVTIVLAWVLNVVFEEPVRKWLRPKK